MASTKVTFCSCFNDADIVFVADVFTAGEQSIKGFDKDKLVSGIIDHGHKNVFKLDDPKSLAEKISEFAESDDIVILLGAGSITNWSNTLVEELNQYMVPK